MGGLLKKKVYIYIQNHYLVVKTQLDNVYMNKATPPEKWCIYFN